MNTNNDGLGADPGARVAHTLTDAVLVAELMADVLRAADEAAGGDAALASRLVVRRLVRRRPEDGELLDVLRWFATTHDLAAARAAVARRSDWPRSEGWPPPEEPAA